MLPYNVSALTGPHLTHVRDDSFLNYTSCGCEVTGTFTAFNQNRFRSCGRFLSALLGNVGIDNPCQARPCNLFQPVQKAELSGGVGEWRSPRS